MALIPFRYDSSYIECFFKAELPWVPRVHQPREEFVGHAETTTTQQHCVFFVFID